MFSFSTAKASEKSKAKSITEDTEKSTSSPILREREIKEVERLSDTNSEVGPAREVVHSELIKSPFKLERRRSRRSRHSRGMEASDPPTPNVSDTALALVERIAPDAFLDNLERPVALSARLR